ncbi:Formate dehydrogenase family accessory protein FdhD [Polymorphum gilvum SL003B-26A1]|uniref:Sulfur carrier protein FdhD n=2 Tax=Polymorphum TaxID=991903 RepID=F2IYU2_POLGS|nr:Formate dehydrogenase family accessory protein FdhD [Polymorphum gilvum SL003B-26A1]
MRRVEPMCWTAAATATAERFIPEETPVALTYNGTTHAVMMASPSDLEDFAYGFSLTEGQIERPEQIRSLDVEILDEGIDLRIWLETDAAARFLDRRRRLSGPTGCGLCGIESLEAAVPTAARVAVGGRFDATSIGAAQRSMIDDQVLYQQTRAVHAAALWTPAEGLVALREDVGRHNALDKLAGALLRSGRTAAGALLLLTSRVSVEMVQKAAVLGAPVLVAVSAPTALAVRTAEAAGITLVASARDGRFDVHTHAERILV